jgi:hypothetical protein
MMDFATNILPATMQAAQMATQMGLPFNVKRYIIRLAEELDLVEWASEMFDDPEFKQRLHLMQQMGPQNPGKVSTGDTIQNSGFSGARPIRSEQTERREFAQDTAGEAQSMGQGVQ